MESSGRDKSLLEVHKQSKGTKASKSRQEFSRDRDLRSSKSFENSKKAYDVLTGKEESAGTLNKRFGGSGKFL